MKYKDHITFSNNSNKQSFKNHQLLCRCEFLALPSLSFSYLALPLVQAVVLFEALILYRCLLVQGGDYSHFQDPRMNKIYNQMKQVVIYSKV